MAVSDVHGQNVDNWVRDGGSITLSAQQSVATIDESDVKEKDVFQAWIVNGARMTSRDLPLKIDKPYYAKAEYATETQFRVKVSSEFGNPTIDHADGWYKKGQEATISVQKQVPMEGFMGALGGRALFDGWLGPAGVESKSPTYAFAVQEPMSLLAMWKTDTSQPMTILAGIAGAIVVLVVIFALYRTGRLSRPSPPPPAAAAKAEATELEKIQAEVESLKEELERVKKRSVRGKKKPPPAKTETTGT